MPETRQFDLVVLGSGPAGEAAALSAAQDGWRVAVVESGPEVGGNCTHVGTIPSKALRHLVRQSIRVARNPLLHAQWGDASRPGWPQLVARAREVIAAQVEVRSASYRRERVTLVNGHGRLLDPCTVEVISPEGIRETLAGRHVLLATGSRPYHPQDVAFTHPRVYDSDSILGMAHTPRHVVIYGAGVIGCEYASIFCGLGIQVDLVNTRRQLLDFLDAEISDALSYHLREQGATIRHGEEYERVEAGDDGVVLVLRSGKRIRADALLWCNGRTGNAQGLGLEHVGLAANERGQVAVDRHYRTVVEGVYAAGDLIGPPSLASAAYDQGRAAVAAMRGEPGPGLGEVPTGIYTIPGISCVGRNERELTEARVPYEVGQAFFRDLARAQITGERTGMLKILFHRDTLALLGIHCFGYQATEIVHIGQAIMRQAGTANTLAYFLDTTFNYPTMAEAYRLAALDGMRRVSGGRR